MSRAPFSFRESDLKRVTGFCVRAGTQTKTFYLWKRVHGSKQPIKLGRVGQITLQKARQDAQQLIGDMVGGTDGDAGATRASPHRAARTNPAHTHQRVAATDGILAAGPGDQPMSVSLKQLRDRAMHYLTPDVAQDAGMSLAQLQQFISGTYMPTPEQLKQLARRTGVEQ